MSSGEIVGYGILQVVDVGHPIAAAHVGNAQQGKHIHSDGYALKVTPKVVGTHPFGGSPNELVLKSYIHTFVGRHTHPCYVACYLWRCHREAVGEHASQAEFKLGKSRKIVGNEEAYAVALVGGARHFHAVKRLLSFHQ